MRITSSTTIIKGITPIVAIVLLMLLAISSFGFMYNFFTKIQSTTQEESFESLKSIATDCVEIQSVGDDMITIYNCGEGVINNDTVKVFFEDIEVPFWINKEILKGETGIIYYQLNSDECSDPSRYTISILTPFGDKVSKEGKYPTDFDKDGIKEGCYNNRIVELSIEDLRSQYLYNGYPLLFLSRWAWYPIVFDFSVGYRTIFTNDLIEYVEKPLYEGNADFKITKCEGDNISSSCVPQAIGDSGNCNDGIVKKYGDLENFKRWTFVWDSNYRDCLASGNKMAIRTIKPIQYGNNRIRVQFSNLELSGEGKHELCVKYKHNILGETEEKCINFVNGYLKLQGTRISNSNMNYGDTLSFSIRSDGMSFDGSQPSYADGRRCRVFLWDYFYSPARDIGISVTFRRHSSWDRHSYFGLFASSRASPNDKKIEITFDLSKVRCKVDHLYNNKCGWWWGVSWKNKERVFSCKKEKGKWVWKKEGCGDSKYCDEFEHTGLPGEIFNITLSMDNDKLSWRDIRFTVWCEDPSVMGNDAYKYRVTVRNADKFWVNDMDYTSQMYFEEAMLPVTQQQYRLTNNVANFDCNIKLTFCGKARYFAEVWDHPLWYGGWWSGNWGTRNNGEYVCVGGAQCPNSRC